MTNIFLELFEYLSYWKESEFGKLTVEIGIVILSNSNEVVELSDSCILSQEQWNIKARMCNFMNFYFYSRAFEPCNEIKVISSDYCIVYITLFSPLMTDIIFELLFVEQLKGTLWAMKVFDVDSIVSLNIYFFTGLSALFALWFEHKKPSIM